MTDREKIIVSAYTGVLMCDFNNLHKYIEDILGRPVFTHEMADKSVMDEIKEKSREEFLAICSTTEPHWIPCSERLPKYMEAVLTWDGSCYCVEKRIPYICDDDGERIEGDWWVSDDYNDVESDYYPNLRDGAADAWMPIPSPYREEGDQP